MPSPSPEGAGARGTWRRRGTAPLLAGLVATALGVVLALALVVASAVAPGLARLAVDDPLALPLVLVLLVGGVAVTVVAAVVRTRDR